jgi:hypothetical protein
LPASAVGEERQQRQRHLVVFVLASLARPPAPSPHLAASAANHAFFRRYYYSEGWRPILPLAFVKAYPKLNALIQECWRVRRKERPGFDQIVKRLQGDIGDEIRHREEPKIELYSEEDDKIYRNRIGKEDEIEDSDGDHTERGKKGQETQAEHEKEMRKVMAEMLARVKKAREEAQAEAKAEQEAVLSKERKAHREQMEQVQHEVRELRERLQEKENGKIADVDDDIRAMLEIEKGGKVEAEEKSDEDVDAEIKRLLGL